MPERIRLWSFWGKRWTHHQLSSDISAPNIFNLANLFPEFLISFLPSRVPQSQLKLFIVHFHLYNSYKHGQRAGITKSIIFRIRGISANTHFSGRYQTLPLGSKSSIFAWEVSILQLYIFIWIMKSKVLDSQQWWSSIIIINSFTCNGLLVSEGTVSRVYGS